MKKEEHVGKYMEVWGDTVDPKELGISALLCIVTTMAFFLIGRSVLSGISTLDPGLAKGYSLLVGILGCFIGAAVCAKMFKPKRKIMIQFEREYIQNGGNACFTRVSAVSLCTFVAYLSLNPAR